MTASVARLHRQLSTWTVPPRRLTCQRATDCSCSGPIPAWCDAWAQQAGRCRRIGYCCANDCWPESRRQRTSSSMFMMMAMKMMMTMMHIATKCLCPAPGTLVRVPPAMLHVQQLPFSIEDCRLLQQQQLLVGCAVTQPLLLLFSRPTSARQEVRLCLMSPVKRSERFPT